MEVLDITNDFPRPGQNYSKMYRIEPRYNEPRYNEFLDLLIKSILKSLVVPVIWLAQIGAIYSQITPFFALNHIIFPATEEVTRQTSVKS